MRIAKQYICTVLHNIRNIYVIKYDHCGPIQTLNACIMLFGFWCKLIHVGTIDII